MDENIKAGNKGEKTEFFLATVLTWDNSKGVRFTIDGQSEPTQKWYKMMLMCRPLHVGSRVVVMKQSGTYIVLGEISNPNSWKSIPDVEAADYTIPGLAAKINEILAWMRTQGILWT